MTAATSLDRDAKGWAMQEAQQPGRSAAVRQTEFKPCMNEILGHRF